MSYKIGKISAIIICVLMVAAVYPGRVQTIMNSDVNPGDPNTFDELDILDETGTLHDLSVLAESTRTDEYFTENHGQVGEEMVKYYIEGKGIWLLDDGVVFDIQESQNVGDSQDHYSAKNRLPGDTAPIIQRKGVALKLVFEGANQVEPKGQNPLLGWSNFYYSNDPNGWQINVPHYNEITYINIYDKIDMVYRITDFGLKYDFIVHPSGDPSDIRMSYEGIDGLRVDSSGDLEIFAGKNIMKDSSLFIYQMNNEDTNEIEGKFKILDTTIYGFELSGDYDKGKDLVIDPLIWSTFVGGNSIMREGGEEVAVGTLIAPQTLTHITEAMKPVFVTGFTCSPDFPKIHGPYEYNGSCDAFVFVLNELTDPMFIIFSTYIGGEKGFDIGTALVLDYKNNVYVTGYTYSDDFPTISGSYDVEFGGYSDGFILSLNITGSPLIFSTFVGGSSYDEFHDIIFYLEDIAVTGSTMSIDFPIGCTPYDNDYNGGLDMTLFMLDLTGSTLKYSTFVGDTEDEIGYSLDWYDQDIFVTGKTNSTNFPTTGPYGIDHNGEYDVFVFGVNVVIGGTLYVSSLVGGSSNETGYEIRMESVTLIVTGETESEDFPNTTNAFDRTYNGGLDVFVFQIPVDLTNLQYSTFLGGDDDDQGRAMDNIGHEIFVTGYTKSENFPTTGWGRDPSHHGKKDAFIFRLNNTGLQYSSYIGGESNSTGMGLFAIGMQAYVTGITYSFDFPTTSSAFDSVYDGGGDVFVFKAFCPIFPGIYIEVDTVPRELELYNDTIPVEFYMELPEGYDIYDIYIPSLMISEINGYPVNIPVNGYPIAYGDYDGDGVPDLMVTVHKKALRAAFSGLVKPPGYAILTMTGALYNKTRLIGSDTILVYEKSARQLKQEAAAMLISNKTGDKKIDKSLDKAIEHIENSLEDALWLDDMHLDPKHGNKVFDEEKKATMELQNLIKDKKVPDALKDLCREVIDNLVEADELLAHIAYMEAKEYSGDDKIDKELEKCEDEFLMVEKELLKGHHHKVIDHYKRAWEHAQSALKHANK